MKTEYTEVNSLGSWSLILRHDVLKNPAIMVGKKVIAELPDWRGNSFERLTQEEKAANSLLIMSAPKGLKVAINMYVKILMTPTEAWRIKNQDSYIELREFISDATGYPAKYVQEFFEQVAFDVKYNGFTIDGAIKNQEKIFEF